MECNCPHHLDDLTEEQLEEIEAGYRGADDPNESYLEWHDDF